MKLNADEITQITATDSMYSSYLYVIEDKDGIEALIELCNGLRYVPTDKVSFFDLMGDTLYTLTFFRNSSTKDSESRFAGVHISPQGYLYYMDFENMYNADLSVYHITSGFDEERLKSLLKSYDSIPVFDANDGEPLFDSDYANNLISSPEN